MSPKPRRKKEFTELEVKAIELDRREKGIKAIEREYSSGEIYEFCGHSETAICLEEIYCSTCGTRLIWQNPIESDGE